MSDVSAPPVQNRDVDAFPEAFSRPAPVDPYLDYRIFGFPRGRNNMTPSQEVGNRTVGVSYSADGALKIDNTGPNEQTFSAHGYEPGSVLSISTKDGQMKAISFTDASGAKSTFDLKRLQDVHFGDPVNLGNGWSAKRSVGANGSETFRVWYNDSLGTTTPEQGIREGRSISVDLATRNGNLVPTYINRREGIRSIELPTKSDQ